MTIVDDSVEDGGETVILTLTAGNGYTVGAPGTHTLTIQNHEPAVPTVTVARKAGTASSMTEGGKAAFTVTRSAAAAATPLAVKLSVSEAAGSDFVAATDEGGRTVTIAADATEAVIEVATVGDDTDEPDGSVTVTVEDGNGYTVSAKGGAASVAVLDDDPAPAATVDPDLVADVRALAGQTQHGQAHVNRWKRVLVGFGVETYPGLTAMTAAAAEANAQQYSSPLWPRIAEALAALEGALDPEPAVSVGAGTAVTEGGDAVFTFTASPAPDADLAVSVTVATNGDYGVTAGSRTVTIDTTGSAVLTLTTTGDGTDEPNGSVTVTVEDGNGYTVGAPASGTVTVQDDDEPAATPAVPPDLVAQVRALAAQTQHGQAHVKRWRRVLVGFGVETYPSLTPMTAAEAEANAQQYSSPLWPRIAKVLAPLEGALDPEPAVSVAAGTAVTEGGDAVFTFTASPAPDADLAVSVTVATNGDYGVTAGSRTVAIDTTGSATLTLKTTGDNADEPNGSVTVTVEDGGGYTVGAPASGTVAIQDDDDPPPLVVPVVSVAAGNALTEGGAAVFTFTASPVPTVDLAVSVTVAADGDYGVTAGSRTVTIDTTGSATLTLATTGDDADEPHGSVSVTVKDGNGYTAGLPDSGTVAVRDDDLPPPVVSIAAKAGSVTEGNAASFTVTADRAPDADLAVTLSVSESADTDHVAPANEGAQTVTIAKGVTEIVFTVATVDDALDEPDGSVAVSLSAGEGYTVAASPADAAAVKVTDNDATALPALSVDDVTVREGEQWIMAFTVRLSVPSAQTVEVRADTREVTAEARQDYSPVENRRLTFEPGDTERQVRVIAYDDGHDEEAETFQVVLSEARGATIADGVGVGTITNDDPLPGAWLARFGRTVAEQALDGIAGRMAASRTPGMQGTLAGQALDFGAPSDAGTAQGDPAPGVPGGSGAHALSGVAQAFGGHTGAPGSGLGETPAQSHTLTARDALVSSRFSLTGEADGGGSFAFWGWASQGHFDGTERGDGTAVTLDGTVTTGMLGADYARGKWLVGLALAQSEGEGDYRDVKTNPRPDTRLCPDGAGLLCDGAVREGDGTVAASLTAVIPYASLRTSERLGLWGAIGYGAGQVTLDPALTGHRLEAATVWQMAAAGLRGDLFALSDAVLAVTSDALWTRTASVKTRDLAASDSGATRLRLGLQGSYRFALAGGGEVVPKLEAGVRHDGGDAETGFGIELSGGIAWSAPALGLSLDLSLRTLLAHENGATPGPGCVGVVRLRPRPGDGAGSVVEPAPATRRPGQRRA